ncbi:hypothetical protein AGLY_004094 [Aphis glycines]|uniref:ATP-dependent DNA helicase n=1 Tax=Aphis glycines TaxID=307491 RepID=A0A6G0TX29_APHGL|nr:hypothetical protein AGLY_004094 [Aphis glycines]
MPSRKSTIGRSTANAKRVRLVRSNENSVERNNRLLQNRERNKNLRNVNAWFNKEYSAMNYDFTIDYKNDPMVTLGAMSIVCQYCLALKWKDESKGMCCSNGKIKLVEICPPPEPLNSLLTGDHPKHGEFKRNIRRYNNAFQMTSFKSRKIVEGNFMPTFKVQGQVYHLAGSLLPNRSDEYKFLQIYFIADPETQVTTRCNIDSRKLLDSSLIRSLQDMLHSHNIYIQSFKTAIESVPPNVPDYNIVIHASRVPTGEHRGRYNAPSTSEVAVVISGQQFHKRDIVLCSRDDNLKKISEIHRSYDSLQYPLMLCRGEDGYSIEIHQIDPHTGVPLQKTVSCMNYYCYRIMERQNNCNMLLRYGMLLNQYLVDQYSKIESERLAYIRNNQTTLRAENYIHLQDALNSNEPSTEIGQLVILPSSFTGGPRYLHEKTQDAMTYVKNYGKPDLFITVTCNPNWEEIKTNLHPNAQPQDRYDIVNRVFHLKIQKLLTLINKANIFGEPRCFMYTVEWQKRGLPHIHLLLWLKNKITPDQIDNVISAELPNKEDDPLLFNSVVRHMIHGPCGVLNTNSPCMTEGRCSKKFPKLFQSHTSTGDDGYPKYRRLSPEEGGQIAVIRNNDIDNRWVVPYNPLLLKIFDAHINVELCSSVKSIKYITKYINKGSDQATFSLDNRNEVEQFQSGRYICSSEAVWRILSFDVHERAPAIIHLAVHLENGQRVFFTQHNVNDIVNNPGDTTLTAFFKLCAKDEFAKTITYDKVPNYYTWNQSIKNFQRRKRGTPVENHPGVKKTDTLGRVYVVHPNNSECFYLRMLLHVIKGPISFASLRTVQGVTYDTFQEACKAMGLLEDDLQWENTLSEATVCCTSPSIRYLFAILIVFCQVTDPIRLWQNHRASMAEDVLFRKQKECPSDDINYDENIFNEALLELNKVVQSVSGKNITDFGLILSNNIDLNTNTEYLRETSYDSVRLLQVVQNERRLNSDQKTVYDAVMTSINNYEGKTFFLDAPGGTGKTFLINLLLAKIRTDRKIALAVASSGIAATLLEGGRTAHSTFKIPLKMSYDDTSSVCNISKQSNTAQLMRDCVFIVWDEASMSHKSSVEALDRTLRDLRNKNTLMGGCTVLFSGDFRQILPVVVRGTRADEVNASLKRSYIWPDITKLKLKTNMRILSSDQGNKTFADALLRVGNGQSLTRNGKIDLSELCFLMSNLMDLIENVYPDLPNISTKTPSWFQERAILSPTNDQVNKINDMILLKFNAPTKVYYSIDTVLDAFTLSN